MTAPAAPRMSTELRVWCFPMMALRTRSNSAKRSCTSGRRFCRLSVKEDARVGESNRQHTSVKFRNNESHSDLQISLRQMYFWNSFWFLPWHRCFSVMSTCTIAPPPGQVMSAVGAWEWRSWWLHHVYRETCFVSSCHMCQSTPEEVCTRLAHLLSASQTGAKKERQNHDGVIQRSFLRHTQYSSEHCWYSYHKPDIY